MSVRVSDDELPEQLRGHDLRWPSSAAPSARGLTPRQGYDEMIADLEQTRDGLSGEQRRQVEELLEQLRAMPPDEPPRLRLVRDDE
jgi:hypothetical protein